MTRLYGMINFRNSTNTISLIQEHICLVGSQSFVEIPSLCERNGIRRGLGLATVGTDSKRAIDAALKGASR